MSQSPEPSVTPPTRNEPSRRSPVIAAGVVAALLAVGAAGFFVGAGRQGAPAQPPMSTAAPAASVSAAPVEPPPGALSTEATVDTVGVSDPEVTAWHNGLAGPIGAAINQLSQPVPTDRADLLRLCQTVTLLSPDLQGAPKAPRKDVERGYRKWAESVDQVRVACETTPADPVRTAAAVDAAVRVSAVSFGDFMAALDLYFDFSTPLGVPASPQP